MSKNYTDSLAGSKTVPREPRQRLPATVRIKQILDAALRVYSERGFAASRIDDIAAAAGLSKGGIYTHFKSKEEIFEALLMRALTAPSAGQTAGLSKEPVTVNLVIEHVVEPIYKILSQPDGLAVLRLLVTDGIRMQAYMRQWHEVVVAPHSAAMAQMVRRGVREGGLRKSVLARAPWLLVAPGVHAMLAQFVFGEAAPVSLAQHRRAHIAMLRELLEK